MSATARKIRLGDEYVEKREIRIIKPCAIVVSGSKKAALKTIADMESELGRLSKLAQQLKEFLRASD
jgi:hypothetical protein